MERAEILSLIQVEMGLQLDQLWQQIRKVRDAAKLLPNKDDEQPQ
jgi:hypothetical protein